MTSLHDDPVAIVGIGIRLPGGNNTPDGFAEFLGAGQSGVGPLPTDRWDPEGFFSDDPEDVGTIRCAQGGFIDKPDHFDAKFFNISPREADFVDPQQRLTLEVAWEALEDAGIDPEPLRHGDGGVYMAVSNMDYSTMMSELPKEQLNGWIGTGMAHSAVSGRLSYFLGWRGPSMTVDTACSASLVSVHLAAQALRAGECGIALAGGVNTIHLAMGHVVASHGRMLAPDGLCKTFDDSADGYCRSEGGAVVVLKRLSDARRSGDRVYALVRGSAVGQDGESSALMVPNGAAQETMLRRALANAGLTPGDISYVETHGTGTSLGDPIEVGALNAVFAESHSPERPVTIASLKTNLGHLESAAGIGGLVKTALQLRERTIFPHLNFHTPSRHIPWDTAPVTVPTTARPWEAETRRAMVNSFGFAGTIASVVLEEAPEPEAAPEPGPADEAEPPRVFTLSAKSPAALRGQIQRYQRFLDDWPDTEVDGLCRGAATGRAHFPLRLAGVVRDTEDVARLLDRSLSRGSQLGQDRGPSQVAFLFSGGGSQYVRMGLPLYEQFPVFRERLDRCDELFAERLGRSLRDMVLGVVGDAELIHEIRYMQPALFMLEYAVAELWLSWGVRPSVLAGHSIGEIVAATVAGLFSLEDAVTLMAARAEVMHASPPGAMAAVEAPVERVAPLVEGREDLSVAAVNGPEQLVLSGGRDSLATVVKELDALGVKNKPIAVSCAAHSPLLAEAAEKLREVVAQLTFHEPRFTLISNLTGDVAVPGELATADYWARHLREPVRFSDGMRAIAARGPHLYLEVGPATELVGMGKQCVPDDGSRWLNSLHPEDADGTVVRQSLAQLYARGVTVDWAAYHAGAPKPDLALPTYAFDRRRHWLPFATGGAEPTVVSGVHPLLGTEIDGPERRAAGEREFGAELSADQPAYLADHKVMGKVVFPGAGYLEMLLALQDAVFGESDRPLRDVTIHEALFLPESGGTRVRTRLRPGADDTAEVEIVSLATAEGADGAPLERRHLTATIGQPTDAPETLPEALRPLAGQPEAEGTTRRADELYEDFAELGVDYGPRFRGLASVRRYGTDTAVGELLADPSGPSAELLPPALLDSAFQSIAALSQEGDVVAMPVGFGRCRLLKKPRGGALRSVLRLRPRTGPEEPPVADLLMLEGERVVFVLEELTLRRVANAAAPDPDRMYSEVRWVKRSLRAELESSRTALLIGAGPGRRAALSAAAEGHEVELRWAESVADAAGPLAEAPTDVCWFWRAGAPEGTEPGSLEALRAECAANYGELLALRDLLDQAGSVPRLWLVTEDGQRLPGDTGWHGEVPPASATLWGFGQVWWGEHPAHHVTLVDLEAGDAEAPRLLDEVLAPPTPDYQVAYRAGHRHVRRVFEEAGGPRTDVELVVKEYGQFTGVVPVPLQDEPEPEGDQIRVRVHAAGLNFKDVLNALGLHRLGAAPDAPELPLGLEGSGVVLAAGPDAEFQPGEEVVVSHLGTFRERLTCSSALAARKPEGVSHTEAAGLPTAYLTAHHGLHGCAGLKRGDRVLIHAAAGGVGQAAVRLALRAGAEVFATASPHKWPLLRELGVTRLYHSRTTDFAEEILRDTGGAGVDVVLNSLSKEFIDASVRALAPEGRFVEMGKLGIWTEERFHAERPAGSFHVFDFSEYGAEAMRELTREVLRPVMAEVSRGELTPLPVRGYSLDEVEEAFSVLSRGANVGKVVLEFGGAEPPAVEAPLVDGDHTYLVTGGTGALGRLVAELLVARGARHLALLSRSAPDPAWLADLRERVGPGTEIVCYQGDVGNEADVERVAGALRARRWPVGGVVHAAGVLADAPVASLTWESIETIFHSKVYGSWLLHRADFPELRFFLGYSSISALIGSRGQANYAAGNAFLDALLSNRHASGLPGLSVNWGAWGETGLASEMSRRNISMVENQGFTFFKPAAGMRALGRVLDRPLGQVIIAEVDWDQYARTRPQPNALYQQVSRASQEAEARIDPAELLALPRAERLETISWVLRGSIADLLHFDGPDDVPADARFFEVGLDSLSAVELKNRLELAFRIALSASSVFDNPSVQQLSAFVDERMTTGGEA
ncbi:SDR family NAD(P)-dependent oxidoreductase [Streptomyces sp. AJS327]|uniref:type I polyketide synthase n=1 Tax=Streptomyces sp. AJS327 TaxID=2545265 RepID=UPI0015E02A12|nr:type I polyketide synthase [Streptomyces sp. AJS327]MBA0049949.1 SDR family NAD(P)-dependent oxidoreductase [Streptomyces sp. AJS327]